MALATFVFVYLGASFGILGIPAALAVLNAILIPAFWAWLIRPACGAAFAEYHRILLLPALATACAAVVGISLLHLARAVSTARRRLPASDSWNIPPLADTFSGIMCGVSRAALSLDDLALIAARYRR